MTSIGPCELCGASPDLGQAHDQICPTQHAPGTVYADYAAARHTPPRERTLTLGAWVSVAALVAFGVLLFVLIAMTKGDGPDCAIQLGTDGSLVRVCPPAP